MFTASDIGWVVGHSYIGKRALTIGMPAAELILPTVYAPLLVGATTVLFEGKPVGTPDASTFWRIVEENKVNVMFTAPTALRAIKLADGDNSVVERVGIVDDEGNEVKPGDPGNIVMGSPLGPTAFTTLWNDEDRFYRSYLKRFDGKWVDTGDAGFVDEEGYISIMSRSDDVINVAAHRFSTVCSRACNLK